MDTPDPQATSPYVEPAMKCTIPNAGNASSYNVTGDYYAAPPMPWVPRVMLSPRAQSFVGREEDLSWLNERLTGATGVTLVIYGPGGIGKTALMTEVLSRLVAQPEWSTYFPDGIFYHSFHTSPLLTVAFAELVRIFGRTPHGNSSLDAKRAVDGRRALLVFDGVECLSDVRPLLHWVTVIQSSYFLAVG